MQEPYTYKGKLITMPLEAVTILPEDSCPMVAVMVHKKDIKTLVYLRNVYKWTICLEMSRGNHKIVIVNIYCQFFLSRDVLYKNLIIF